MARLQETMIAGPAPRLHASSSSRASVLERFGRQRGGACWAEFAKKRLNKAAAEEMTARVQMRWPDIRRRIGAIARPARELEEVLRRVGAPVTPEALGWQPAFYRQAVRHAREIRNRWTFLDLAADSGVFSNSDMAIPA
jgi:glycerol-1-phosphate dehydrogenase [NAD(P)+]